MTKTIPGSYTQANVVDYRTSSPVAASDATRWIDNQNLLWARWVADWGGHAFDPAFKTSDTSLTQTNSASSRDLNELNFGGRADNKDDASNFRVGVEVFGTNITVEFQVQNEVDGTTAVSSTSDTITGTNQHLAFAVDFASSGHINDYLSMPIQATSPDGNEATFDYIRVGLVERASSTKLPTG